MCAEMMEPQERDAWFSQASDRFYFLEVMRYPHEMEPNTFIMGQCNTIGLELSMDFNNP